MACLQLFFFIVASSLFMFMSPSHSSLDYANVKTLSPAKSNDKVTLSLYYEALCPYCASFISDHLVKVFQNDLNTIVNLRLVPWGNAVIAHNRTQCQNGEDECYLNTIHSCVIYLWPDVEKHFEFILCTEQQSLHQGPLISKEAMWKNCSEKLRLSENKIKQCYNSGYGCKLQQQCANETTHLSPPVDYVPWVVVNNQPLYEDVENYAKYVCQDYKGDHLPEACKPQPPSVSSTNKKAKKIHPGCYASKFRDLESSIPPKQAQE
ncbi:hypothetical protein REPUB_Repub02eG0284900 [Reevesia pubescens]